MLLEPLSEALGALAEPLQNFVVKPTYCARDLPLNPKPQPQPGRLMTDGLPETQKPSEAQKNDPPPQKKKKKKKNERFRV